MALFYMYCCVRCHFSCTIKVMNQILDLLGQPDCQDMASFLGHPDYPEMSSSLGHPGYQEMSSSLGQPGYHEISHSLHYVEVMNLLLYDDTLLNLQ